MECIRIKASELATTSMIDNREFVHISSFLELFQADRETSILFRQIHGDVSMGDTVEKRINKALLPDLERHCLSRRLSAEYSPIVAADGWVFWVRSGGHRLMLEALAMLYSSGDSDDVDFTLQHGLVWHILSVRPHKILCGSGYEMVPEDKEIFELFEVERISQFF